MRRSRSSTAATRRCESVTEQTPDLVILDLNLPVLSGTEVCRILRGRPATANVPIIMLTARTGEADRVTGLDLGADDYVTKPFSLRELAARVRAVLRRRQGVAAGANVYTGAHLTADFDAVAISVDGAAVRLTRREFELLQVPGREPQSRAVARPPARARLGLRPLHRDAVGRRPRRPPAMPSSAPPDSRSRPSWGWDTDSWSRAPAASLTASQRNPHPRRLTVAERHQGGPSHERSQGVRDSL